MNEEFEKWFAAQYGDEPDRKSALYYAWHQNRVVCGVAWQASRKQALEDAAKVCDRIMRENDADSPYHAGGAELCAEAIRALQKE